MLTVFQDTPQDRQTQQEDIIKTNAHLAKEVISETTKLEQVISDPRKNPVFYDADITVIDVNIVKKGKSYNVNRLQQHGKWITSLPQKILNSSFTCPD